MVLSAETFIGEMKKWKQIINNFNLSGGNSSDQIEPEIGFKCLYCEEKKQLIVRVIGARHLPTLYGNTRPHGYLIKVRVSPGRDKYDTEIITDSDPMFNQEFNFELQKSPNRLEDIFTGKFVMFTIYAILEAESERGKLRRKESFSKQLKGLMGLNDPPEFQRDGGHRNSRHRISMNNRRTVGAVTYNLESKMFTQRMRYNCVGTPDIWREIQSISSGIKTEPKENSKGSLEMTMCYSISEDGNNEMVEVSLSRLRCSMPTMQEHEKLGGSLYIKITAYEYDVLIASWKSDRFEPTISMKIESKTATLQAVFRNYNVSNIKIVVRLMCKNMIAKKILLGKIEIDSQSDIWKQIISNPSTSATEMVNFR